ncbi:MAG: ROK family protein [Armatimonadetes bacterium]|nr:ROK family protein [Armatimonadota bacterium]
MDKTLAGTSAAFIGLDIGNTRLTVGAADADGCLLLTEERSAPRGAESALPVLLAMARSAASALRTQGRRVAGLGLGFGGPVDYAGQRTRGSFHSPGWVDVPLAEFFASELRIPALLDNDANAGGLAEALFGAGRRHRVVLYVNVGTGIGGAIVIEGTVHRGATSSAGEIGHVVLDPEGPVCNCGKRGCLEAFAAGSALERMASEAGLSLTGRETMAAAEQGDVVCRAIVEQAAGHLGLAIANAVSLLDPDIVVPGGGVPLAGEVWWTPLREAFSRQVVPAAARTRLAPAELGYHAGVLGAAALGMQAAEGKGLPT